TISPEISITVRPVVLLKKTGLIVLAILAGISSSSAFLLFAFRRLGPMLITITPERRMESVDFFVALTFYLVAGFFFGVTSTAIAPRAGSVLVGTAAILGFIFLAPSAGLLEGRIMFSIPLACSAAVAWLAWLGQGVVHRFWRNRSSSRNWSRSVALSK